MVTDIDQDLWKRLAKQLADGGKPIEAGWTMMRAAVVPAFAPPDQISAMRIAFMCGAQHLLSTMVAISEEGDDPTPDYRRRMDVIQQELDDFTEEMQREEKKGRV